MAQGFTIERRDHLCVVTLETDLTAALVAPLKAALKEALSAGATGVELDLARATMLDSSGIGLLIATANSLARSGGRVRVTNASKDIRTLLHSMRLTTRLDVPDRA